MSEFLFQNGTILTMDETRGLYAEALLVRDGVIAAVGDAAAVAAEANSPEIIDLHGATLMPSFIDPHSHLSSYAMGLQQIALEGVKSYEEIIARVQQYLKDNNIPAGQWVTAHGYDHNALAERRPPDRTVLDAAAPQNPLVLQHVSGHTGVFNTLALQGLGLNADTPDPPGGRFARAADGSLTGYAEENAFIETIKRMPQPGAEQLLACYTKAQQCYAAYGITTVQDGLIIDQMAPLYQGLCAAGTLFLDTVAYVDFRACETLLKTFADHLGAYRQHFKIGGYKTFLDGSPQARTAWLRTPYLPAPGADEPKGYRGYPAMQDDELFQQLCRALRDGRQVLAHCNGDAAAQQYLDQFARAKAAVPGAPDIRPVMVHAQFLDRDQLPMLKKLGMIPSFFVAHVYHWGDIHIQNVGLARAARISCTASALAEGIKFTARPKRASRSARRSVSPPWKRSRRSRSTPLTSILRRTAKAPWPPASLPTLSPFRQTRSKPPRPTCAASRCLKPGRKAAASSKPDFPARPGWNPALHPGLFVFRKPLARRVVRKKTNVDHDGIKTPFAIIGVT